MDAKTLNHFKMLTEEDAYTLEEHLESFENELLKIYIRSQCAFNEKYWYPCDNSLKRCESIIEEMLLIALASLVAGSTFTDIDFVETEKKYQSINEPRSPEDLIIFPQANIGDYRVDFKLKYLEFDCRCPDNKGYEKELLIECDGHDFHERTKEQARKDKKRDRDLTALGFSVLRFTGSEIWEDPFKCAREIHKQLIRPNRSG